MICNELINLSSAINSMLNSAKRKNTMLYVCQRIHVFIIVYCLEDVGMVCVLNVSMSGILTQVGVHPMRQNHAANCLRSDVQSLQRSVIHAILILIR